MSITPATVTAAQLTTAAAVYYTAPANTRSIVKKLTFTNTTGTARTVTVHLVPNGGTASATNMLISAHVVAPNDTYECYEAQGQVLQAAGTIQALSDLGTAVAITGAMAEVR